jgi:hypothetical protein
LLKIPSNKKCYRKLPASCHPSTSIDVPDVSSTFYPEPQLIELDYGKFETGKPYII